MTAKKTSEPEFCDEEIARRYEATLKRVLSTSPKHKTAKGEKANPPKKRGRPLSRGMPKKNLS